MLSTEVSCTEAFQNRYTHNRVHTCFIVWRMGIYFALPAGCLLI